jgi:hypothetical protein
MRFQHLWLMAVKARQQGDFGAGLKLMIFDDDDRHGRNDDNDPPGPGVRASLGLQFSP